MERRFEVDMDITSKHVFDRDQQLYATAAERIRRGDADPSRREISLEDAMGSEEYLEYQATDADSIAETDLFD